MATIAKSSITLVSISDAYSVSLQPSNITINTDYKGNNPELTNAKTTISLFCGNEQVAISQCNVIASSVDAADKGCTLIKSGQSYILTITGVEKQLSGWRDIEVYTEANQRFEARFAYTIVRETSMLDWILDWEGRAKTEIAGEHIITPKIFVGKSENGGQLTGTYIGPAFDGSGRTGVFGYSAGVEIFHLDNTGGMIGGWQITTDGITTVDGNLKILSEGSIISAPGGTLAWELKKDGSATFAKENVKFSANGDAEFTGKITSKSGSIGGWKITQNQLNSNRVIIDSNEGIIGINASQFQQLNAITGDLVFPETPTGGVKMWYSSANDFGFAGWSTSKLVFQLGSVNQIAGWKFDDTSLWLGTKNNTARQNTVDANSVTIGTSGLRGKNWYIDTDGEISFVNGLIHFTANGGTICGWTLTADHLAAGKSALVSATGYVGLYLSHTDLPEAVSSYEKHIRQNGGIYLTNGPAGPYLRGNTYDGKMAFQLCSSVSYIGGWNFSNSCLFTGAAPTDAGAFATQGNITLSPDGLRGYKFRLEANGSGAIAGGNISWNETGDITFVGTKMKWTGTNTTIIDANGIFTGKISASNIVVGSITTDWIKNGEKWGLLVDGSGYLAAKNIIWDKDGNINVKGSFSQDIHYAYKCDATIVSRSSDSGLEEAVVLKLQNQLYIATNALDAADSGYRQNGEVNDWPYQLSDLNYYTIILPNDPKFIGKEIKIYDCNYGPFSRQLMGWCNTTIKVESDMSLITKALYEGSFSKENLWKSITIRGGYASFVCIPTRGGGCMWICVDFYGALCQGIDAKGTEHFDLLQ